MWVARDKNGNLNLFQTKPIRKCDYKWEEDTIYKHSIEIDINIFLNLTWKDEPVEVEISAKGCIDNLIDLNIKAMKEIEELKKSPTLHIGNNTGTININ